MDVLLKIVKLYEETLKLCIKKVVKVREEFGGFISNDYFTSAILLGFFFFCLEGSQNKLQHKIEVIHGLDFEMFSKQ